MLSGLIVVLIALAFKKYYKDPILRSDVAMMLIIILTNNIILLLLGLVGCIWYNGTEDGKQVVYNWE